MKIVKNLEKAKENSKVKVNDDEAEEAFKTINTLNSNPICLSLIILFNPISNSFLCLSI